jgi:hypothetical protein
MSATAEPHSVRTVVRWYNPLAMTQSGLVQAHASLEQAEQALMQFTLELTQRGMQVLLADVHE